MFRFKLHFFSLSGPKKCVPFGLSKSATTAIFFFQPVFIKRLLGVILPVLAEFCRILLSFPCRLRSQYPKMRILAVSFQCSLAEIFIF